MSKEFEYLYLSVHETNLQETLTSKGKGGWDLIKCFREKLITGYDFTVRGYSYTLIFRKEITLDI